jgi:hypothetical protein
MGHQEGLPVSTYLVSRYASLATLVKLISIVKPLSYWEGKATNVAVSPHLRSIRGCIHFDTLDEGTFMSLLGCVCIGPSRLVLAYLR